MSGNGQRRVALFGVGKIGRMIAALLSASGDYEFVVADIDERRLDRVAGIRAYPSRAST